LSSDLSSSFSHSTTLLTESFDFKPVLFFNFSSFFFFKLSADSNEYSLNLKFPLLSKPKYFIPVHGEYRQLTAHANTAEKMGVEKENIFIMNNGRVLEINEDEAKFTSTVPAGRILVDGLGVGDVGNIVLRDRQRLSQDGLIIIVLTMDSRTGTVVAGPDVLSRGFVYVRESENLMEDIKQLLRAEIDKFEEKHITDWSTIKAILREELRDYIYKKTKRDPMILPIIMEV
jgi:ribonuclease J